MLHIGITYNPTIDLYTSGLNQTVILLTELFKELGYKVSLISIKISDTDWWNDFLRIDNITTSNIYENNNLDYLIDVDGLVKPMFRRKLAKNTIVFLRTFLQFTEMDNSVYPEKTYIPRYYEEIQEIWCWDILNHEETIPSIQTLFNVPIRSVPFIWSNTTTSYYSQDRLMKYDQNSKWNVHISENNTNMSSSVIPLVAVRELVHKKIIDAKYKCHNMERIIENKFLKENILNNIEIPSLPISFEKKEPFYNWITSENNILFSHSRFTPIRIGLINALWLGLPVIHNSLILKTLDLELEKLFYFGNEFSGIVSAFSSISSNPDSYYNSIMRIRNNILSKWSIQTNLEKWRKLTNSIFVISKIESIQNNVDTKEIIISFSDMWPGFNYNSNFIIDALKHYSDKIIIGQEYNSNIVPNLVIFGPYSDKWKEIPNTINKVFFSAENWNMPEDCSIKLFLTSSRNEDNMHIRIPTWMTFIDWFSESTILPEKCEDNPIRIPLHFVMNKHHIPFDKREHFCGFVVSNPACSFRNESFMAINNYKKVNSGGALYNNIGGQLSLKYPGGGCGDISKYHFFSNHKFTISFENSQAPGYITEKVLHSKIAGCIPIYWGDNETDTDFVPNSFINISNINDPQKVVEVLKLLETNTNICNHYSSTPILDETKKIKALDIINKMAIKLIDLATNTNKVQKMPNKIDKIYLINLDTRSDRLENLYKEEPYLKNITTRISAVNGKTLKMNDEIYSLFKNNTFQWKKSVMGCNLSHINIWSEIIKQTGNYFLVLEDDVRFNNGWLNEWNKYAENIPEDAELLYLGGVLPPNKIALPNCLQEINKYWSEIKPNTFFSQTPLPIFHFCAYSYILTKKGAEKILRFLKESELKSFTISDHLLGSPHINLKKYISNQLFSFCFQENDPTYCNSDFNSLHRTDNFDSDIWNNTECFTDEELLQYINPVNKNIINLFYFNGGKEYGLYEENWICDIFKSEISLSPLDSFETVVPDNSWFVVQRPYSELFSEYFKFLQSYNINFKVLHLSDEFSKDSIDYYSYNNCKAVIRNYLRDDTPNLPHIFTIPLGYHYKGTLQKTFNDRKLVWSFHGTNWFDRSKILENICNLIPHHIHFTNDWNHPDQTSKNQYLAMLSNSKFCPILRGNNIETYRLYEALEVGTIPIYVRIPDDSKFWKLISSKLNLYELDTWDKAKEIIIIFLNNPELAEKYRQNILTKWNQWKLEIKSICTTLI